MQILLYQYKTKEKNFPAVSNISQRVEACYQNTLYHSMMFVVVVVVVVVVVRRSIR
jgi:hypothetical protein